MRGSRKHVRPQPRHRGCWDHGAGRVDGEALIRVPVRIGQHRDRGLHRFERIGVRVIEERSSSPVEHLGCLLPGGVPGADRGRDERDGERKASSCLEDPVSLRRKHLGSDESRQQLTRRRLGEHVDFRDRGAGGLEHRAIAAGVEHAPARAGCLEGSRRGNRPYIVDDEQAA